MTTGVFAPTAVDILMDETSGDMALVQGEATFSEGLQAIAQGARIRFNLWRGEWLWNAAEGLPMLSEVMARGIPLDDIRGVFSRGLLLVPGVRSVTRLEVSRLSATRELVVDFVAKTNAGLLAASDFAPFVLSYAR